MDGKTSTVIFNGRYKFSFERTCLFTFALKNSCAYNLSSVKLPAILKFLSSIKSLSEELFLIFVSFLHSSTRAFLLLSLSFSCSSLSFVIPGSPWRFLEMVKLKKLVETEEAIEKFIADYRIPPNVGLRYCEEGEWHFRRKTGEVVILILAFIEGSVRIPMGPVNRNYLRHFRLAPTQYAANVFRILGCVDALNEKMGLTLTHHDVN